MVALHLLGGEGLVVDRQAMDLTRPVPGGPGLVAQHQGVGAVPTQRLPPALGHDLAARLVPGHLLTVAVQNADATGERVDQLDGRSLQVGLGQPVPVELAVVDAVDVGPGGAEPDDDGPARPGRS